MYLQYRYGWLPDLILWNADFLAVLLLAVVGCVALFLWLNSTAGHRRLLGILLGLVVLTLLVGGWFAYREDVNARQYWNMRLFSLAKGYATAAENLHPERIPNDETAENHPDFKRLLGVFETWQSQDDMIINVCLFRCHEDDELVYLVRPGADYNGDGKIVGDLEEYAPPGRVYGWLNDEPVLLNAIRLHRPQFTDFPLYADALPWLYAAVPLKDDRLNDRLLLVIDFRAKHWLRSVAEARRLPIIATSLFLLLIFSGTVEIVLLRRSLQKRNLAFALLAESEIKHRKIIDNSHDAICLLQDRKFIFCNRRMCLLFDRNTMQFEETTPLDISLPIQPDGRSSAEQWLKHVRLAEKGHSQFFEWTFQRPGGEPFLMEIQLDAIEISGQTLLIAVAHDLSEQRRAIEAEREAKIKSAFLAHMSHEIRTPMTSILGYTELLLKDDLLPATNRSLADWSPEFCREIVDHCQSGIEIIRNNAEFLLSILNDILDLSKMEANKMLIEQLDVPIRPLLRELASLYDLQASAKGLRFRIEERTPLPESIRIDPIRVKQILVNLIGNAVKFTQKGEVVVAVSWVSTAEFKRNRPLPKTGEESLCQSDGVLVFEVRDTGIGMSPEQLELLFKPFSQADASMSRRFGGTGLGLTISKRLAELLDGRLSVASREGEGSTFTVSLPQPLPKDGRWTDPNDSTTVVPETVSVPTKSSILSLAGLQILLVEDGLDNQRLFSLILKKAGADVSLAENGEDAVDLATKRLESGSPYDLILMDMQMPVMDGYAATRRLRELQYAAPIVALTAHAMKEDQEKCLDAGCNDYIIKPIHRDALLVAVRKNVEP